MASRKYYRMYYKKHKQAFKQYRHHYYLAHRQTLAFNQAKYFIKQIADLKCLDRLNQIINSQSKQLQVDKVDK